MKSNYYIGLMSGTSIDAIDAVIIDLNSETITCIADHTHPFPPSTREAILLLANGKNNHIEELARVDVLLGRLFAEAVNTLLTKANMTARQITAIGSHGQTIRHCPKNNTPFTMQIGDPNVIAALTGITTVADFRRKDIAHGGQGAPFAPLFHRVLFNNDKARAIVNIGGIANITYLPAERHQAIIAFDTGPGNVLLDSWCHQHLGNNFDHDGIWATSGHNNTTLLQQLLADDYFHLSPPKSTGREYFNLSWLNKHLKNIDTDLLPQDVQATLTTLTAKSIANAVLKYLPSQSEVIISGGGAHNTHLMKILKQCLPENPVNNMQAYNIDPDNIEAMAFAWFAQQTLSCQALDLRPITGAQQTAILGGIYYASSAPKKI